MSAQWSGIPDVNNVICNADSNQHSIDIVEDGKGGAIIVWEDERDQRYGCEIFAQRIGSDGICKWFPGGIRVCQLEGDQRRPRAVSDGNGGAIIVWDDTRNGDVDIYAQRLDSTGTLKWSLNGVPVCTAPWAQQYPVIAADTRGGAFIAWQDTRATGFSVYAQHMTAAGLISWTDVGIRVSGSSQAAVLPQVTGNGNDDLIVVWEDGRTPANGPDIYVQRLDIAGNLMWVSGGVALCAAPGAQKFPRLVGDTQQGAIVAWQDARGGTSNTDVYAQRIERDGRISWLTNGLSVCSTPEKQGPPEIVSDGSDGAIVAWSDLRVGYTAKPYAQRITSAGFMLWQTNGFDVCPTARGADQVRVAHDGTGGAALLWTDSRSGHLNLYAQHVDAVGSATWSAAGVPVCTAAGDQHFAEMHTTGSGGWIIGWLDRRVNGINTDIYASYLYTIGAIPVQLVSFSVAENAGVAVLRWKTEAERWNLGFEVQRRFGSVEWNAIGFVTGNGSSDFGHAYEFTDTLAMLRRTPGVVSYRLIQHDYDGKAHVLPTVSLELSASLDDVSIRVAPNPCRGTGVMTLFLPEVARVRASVFSIDARQRLLLLDDEWLERGYHILHFNPGQLTPGTYFLTLQAGSRSATQLLLLTR